MITAYFYKDGIATSTRLVTDGQIPSNIIWLDVLSPTSEEAIFVGKNFHVEIPSQEELKEIETSSRLYSEAGNIYMTPSIVVDSEKAKPTLGDMAFILTPNHFISIRYATPKSIDICASRILKKHETLNTPVDMMLLLLDVITDRLADMLEMAASRIESITTNIFESTREDGARPLNVIGNMRHVLKTIGTAGKLTSKVRSSISSLERLLPFAHASLDERMTKEQQAMLKTLDRDLRSLNEHAAFLNNECSFMLNAALGSVSIHQNMLVTLFSIVAVIFLPPTLIASIYGMNFEHMPELASPLGYPITMVLILLSAVVPYIYFRWKKWL